MALGLALGIAGGVVAALFAAWHGLTYYFVNKKCQRPNYKLLTTIGQRKTWLGLKTQPAVQVRQYSPYLIAQVTMQGDDMRNVMGNGFRQIAGFIFGKNIADENKNSQKVEMTAPVKMEISENKNQKIQMTAPVTSQFLGEQTYQIAFVMPSKYTKDTLPKPVSQKVKIREVNAHKMAAMGWNGSSPNKKQTQQKSDQLKKYLKQAGLRYKGNVHLYQYHPPFSPPWMRQNEVLFELQE